LQIGKNQAAQQPTAFGSMLQASTYGMAIPVIFGRTQSPLLAIWAANLRQGGSTKKFKQMKKGLTAYCENINFLIGKNPIMGVLQMWNNSALYPLTFTDYSVTTGNFGTSTFTVPDADFYAVIAVTVTVGYSQAIDDYGSQGAQTLSGSYEVPLWNQLFAGPDPTDGSASRNFPWMYRWQPSYGATVYIDQISTGGLPAGSSFTVKIYYAQLMAATSYQPPIAKNRLSFENILGSGDEYDGFTSQQIQYPWYAGLGSPDIDLGSSGAIPSLQAEVQGKYGLYPTGDGDFVDMIEDILKSGITQAALGGSLNFGPTQHGVGCYTFPGCVQKKLATWFESAGRSATFDMPNQAGNVLVCILDADSNGSADSISDSLGNTWVQAATETRIGIREYTYTLWYCVNCKGGANTVTVVDTGFYARDMILLELAGVDTFDSVATAVGTQPSVSITTTNAPGYAGLLLAISLRVNDDEPVAPTAAETELWPVIVNGLAGGDHDGPLYVQQRNVKNPGTYSLEYSLTAGAGSYLTLIAFKATQPPNYPNPLPDLLDPVTRELTRMQCRANGLWGSLSMNAQKAASDWINDLVSAANCAPVYSGFQLKLIPRSEASFAGNGAIYISPTAGGPVANLDADNGDFVSKKGDSPIKVVRKARTDTDTVLQMQHLSRNANYQQVITAVPDPASIAIYGVRKKDPTVNNAIQDPAIARALLTIEVRRRNYIEPLSYQFTLNARWGFLEAMDLVTITDRQQGIVGLPVRLTSTEENSQYELACEAEPFVYGISAPQALPADTAQPYTPNVSTGAGNVNAPVIFEPVPRLYANQNQRELWLVISSSATNYGGCQVMISTDGGNSYNSAGDPLLGSAVTGVTTADWPAASDPDTTNNLAVNLSESLGVLDSYQTSDENNFLYPCYVAGGGSTSIPYELMTYAIATMTAANQYTLQATGSGNELRRAVFNAPQIGAGVDHPSGSRFAFLSPDGTGILKLVMDPAWVGQTLYFKILSFNNFGSGQQSLSDVSAYSYTPTGASGAVNPGGLPAQGFQINGT
jgi:hypothetical protein